MNLPSVSVIMAIRNESAHIADSLQCIASQDYPHDKMEVIIADGMSTDNSRQIIDSISLRNIKVIDNTSLTRAHGLNAAILASTGEVVVRVDARTIIAPDYVSKCVNTLLATNADNVGGIQRVIANTVLQRALSLALSSKFGVGNAQYRIGRCSGFVDTVYLGCFLRSVFARVGHFDDSSTIISEDSDLNYRIRKAGGRIYLNTDIESGYRPRDSLADIGRIYYRYGGARAGNFKKHHSLSLRQAIPALFVVFLVIAAFLSIRYENVASIFYFTTVMYLLIDLLVSLRLSVKSRQLLLLPVLFILFPTIHICWGLGFWKKMLIPDRSGKYWVN